MVDSRHEATRAAVPDAALLGFVKKNLTGRVGAEVAENFPLRTLAGLGIRVVD